MTNRKPKQMFIDQIEILKQLMKVTPIGLSSYAILLSRGTEIYKMNTLIHLLANNLVSVKINFNIPRFFITEDGKKRLNELKSCDQ